MTEASIWMMTLGIGGIIGGFVLMAAKLRELYHDMFDHDEPSLDEEFEIHARRNEPSATIEDIVRKEAA